MPGATIVLPRDEGILFSLDPDNSASLAADGENLYGLTAAGAPARLLTVTVGGEVSEGPSAGVAIGAGPSRLAWRTKAVQQCSVPTGACTRLPAPTGQLSLDPAWAPNGKALAYVVAAPSSTWSFPQATVSAWYATHHLWLLRGGSRTPVEIAGTAGASVPTWSADGQSLVYVADDALWLIPRIGAHPVKVAWPLFPTNDWPSYYGQIDWSGQFAWHSPQ